MLELSVGDLSVLNVMLDRSTSGLVPPGRLLELILEHLDVVFSEHYLRGGVLKDTGCHSQLCHLTGGHFLSRRQLISISWLKT